MPTIEIPFPFADLPLKPELTSRVVVSAEMTQTLATLMGWDGNARRLVKTSHHGVLQTISPQASSITIKTASGDNEAVTFASQATNEVMLQAGLANAGNIYIAIGAAVGASNYWILAPGDVVILSLDDLNRLNAKILTSGDKLHVLITR